MTEYEARLSAALSTYPQGYSTSSDLAAHWLIKVRADDVRQLLGDAHAYRETMRIISSEEQPIGSRERQRAEGNPATDEPNV